MNSQISKIHTSCKDCVFATYSGITQHGCSLNYLDKYKEQQITILEAYDNDKEFFLINDKKCIGYRENKWFKQFNLDNASLEDKISKYLELNKISYSLVIDLKKIDQLNLNNILSSVTNLDIKPEKIVLIRYAEDDKNFPYEYINSSLQKYELINSPWRIQTVLDSSTDFLEILHNINMNNIKSRFVAAITNEVPNLNDIIQQANDIVHKKLDQFMVITNKNNSCLLYSLSVYRYGWIVNQSNVLTQTSEHMVI